MEPLPRLRTDINFIPARSEDGEVLVIQDTLGIVSPNMALNPSVAPYLGFFDGTATVDDLQEAITRHSGGVIVFQNEVEGLVSQLDQLGLLQTERYFEARERIVREFSDSSERPAILAGSSYPAEAEALALELDGMLGLPEEPAPSPSTHPCALAAPHLDLRVAGRTYGTAYRAIAHLNPSTILILGTGHSLGPPLRFSLTGKTFVTPLGKLEADREAAAALGPGSAVTDDDFTHRNEHSIELQLLFLQRIFPMEDIPILPVLCGSFDDLCAEGRDPAGDPGISSLVKGLRDWLAAPPAGKLVVAGIDLSHVGPKFGDPEPASLMEAETRNHDRELLEAMEKGDAEAFFRAGSGDNRRFKVCGFSTIWILLSLFPGARGTVLDYHFWHEEATSSAVSCTAVVFETDGE